MVTDKKKHKTSSPFIHIVGLFSILRFCLMLHLLTYLLTVADVVVVVEVVVTGYYSSSRRAAQTPCEDIQIRFPLPEPWIYLFRVERRFKYGSVHSATRRPGRIKGLERLTQLAQGILPPSLIEVTAGLAKYEHVFKAIVWRIDQLPERNEGISLLRILSISRPILLS